VKQTTRFNLEQRFRRSVPPWREQGQFYLHLYLTKRFVTAVNAHVVLSFTKQTAACSHPLHFNLIILKQLQCSDHSRLSASSKTYCKNSCVKIRRHASNEIYQPAH